MKQENKQNLRECKLIFEKLGIKILMYILLYAWLNKNMYFKKMEDSI